MAQFSANFSYVGESDGVLMAGLADDQYETVNYLLFQKATDPSAQDVELGHDQVHVTRNGEASSCHGGVERVSLSSNELYVRVDSSTAEKLGTAQDFAVSFDHGLDGLDELSVVLENLFESFVDRRS